MGKEKKRRYKAAKFNPVEQQEEHVQGDEEARGTVTSVIEMVKNIFDHENWIQILVVKTRAQ